LGVRLGQSSQTANYRRYCSDKTLILLDFPYTSLIVFILAYFYGFSYHLLDYYFTLKIAKVKDFALATPVKLQNIIKYNSRKSMLTQKVLVYKIKIGRCDIGRTVERFAGY
jgi:hypothetical protein